VARRLVSDGSKGEKIMHAFWQDLRHGARMLFHRPSFTFIAVLTLSLGIGATTAIFSVVDAVLLRALPYPAPERLVQLREMNRVRASGLPSQIT
jgi:hypothetical protein